MPSLDSVYPDVVHALAARYGRPSGGAGPGDRDPFEAVVAVALGRMLDAPKARAAVEALREDGLLEPQALAESDPDEAVESLRSAGVTVTAKALTPLLRVARWVADVHHGAAAELADPDGPVPTARIRDELRAMNGVGPAGADELLLFAMGRAAYPVDRATYRVLVRHGWADPTADYDEARDVVERQAPDDAGTLAELSGWFDRLGRDHCRATVAKCDRCPLQPFLPESGPVDPRE